MLSSLSRSTHFISRVASVRIGNNASRFASQYIVKSPVEMPELSSPIVNTPLPHFIMKDFLSNERANNVAIVDGFTAKELTFGDVHYHTYSLADSLRDLGLKKGDCVAIMSPNHIYYMATFLAVSLNGGIPTCVNPLYGESELSHQLNITEAKIVFTHPMCLDKVLAVTHGKAKVIVMDEGVHVEAAEMKRKGVILMSMLHSNAVQTPKYDHNENFKSFDPDSIATIPFSSGTTGKSKGVMLTHKNIVSNVIQAMPYEGNYLQATPTKERGTLLCPLPFFHIYGLTAGMFICSNAGGKLVFMPSFDLMKFLELIQKHKVTRAFVVPPIVLALAKHPVIDKFDLSSVECLMSGAAPLGVDVQVAAAKRLKCIVKQAWGMTETSPCGTITPDYMIKTIEGLKGTSGQLAPATEAKIIDPKTGADIHPSEPGELLVRGPQIMKGYYKDPEATKNTIRPDGFMHTGDIGHFDKEGWLYLTDRMKELIKYKGFQVPPAELEAVIASMPEVKDVIVIPVPDDEAGEVPRAYVVKQDNCPKDFCADDVIEFVHSAVAPYKRLRGGVIFTDAVPKSPSGKLLRRVQIEIDRQAHENPHHSLK